jgi:anti-sigma factor RsiW
MSCSSWQAKLEPYADGELSPSESAEIARHLRQCHDCSTTALDHLRMKHSIAIAGKRYSPSSDFRAKITRSLGTQPKRQRGWAWKAILVPSALVLLLSLGVNLYLNRARSQRERVYAEIADLHISTLASATPVDVVSTDRHTVKPWFEGKIPFTFNLPELQGTDFVLVGGRVAYLGQSPGAQLIYRLRKHEISVFVFQDRGEGPLPSSAAIEAFSFHVENWTRHGFVIGDVSADDIESLGRLFGNTG